MNEKNEHKRLIPSLRFPEFKNRGEWVEKKLGEVGDFTGSGVDKKIKENEKLVMLLNYMDVYKNNFIYKEDLKQQTSATIEKIEKCNIKKGDIFFTPTSEVPDDIAQSAVLVEDIPNGVYSYHLIRLRLKENWDLKFRTYIFKTNSFFKTVSKLAQGSGTRYVITMPVFNSLKIPIPSLPEQQKIADFLSNLDELIAAHKQKLELLKQHKKGLMQNLFPQEGKKLPEWRFPEFQNSGEWVEKKLGEVVSKIGDGIHSTPKYDVNGKYYFINGNNLVNGKIFVDNKTKRISKDEFKKNKLDLTEKTILLSINGTIGNVAFYKNENVLLGKSACYINLNEKINNVFLFYILQSSKIKSYFLSELTGSTIKNLSLKSIRETKINLPTKQEQQKIADFLSNLDEMITAETEKIEQLERHKKGLMQKMFPVV